MLPKQHKIKVNGIELAFVEWEGPENQVVLLLHATGFHARCWDATVKELGRHCRVIAVDVRGHGRSSKTPPYDWQSLSRDIVELLVKLGLKNVVGVGHSMGGYCVLAAASELTAIFDSLVLVDPVIMDPDRYREDTILSSIRDPSEHPVSRRKSDWNSVEEMIERFQDRKPFSLWRPDVLEDYCHYGLLESDQGRFTLACPPMVEAGIYMNTTKSVVPDFAHIELPILVMRGQQKQAPRDVMDFSYSPTWSSLAKQFKHGQDMYLPELTHFIPMERPDLVAEQIRLRLN